MGRYVPRIVSPITGHEEAAPGAERLSFPTDEQNLSRWRTVVEAREPRAVRVVRVHRDAHDRRLLVARLLDRLQEPGPARLERLRLHLARGERARRRRRRLVRHDVPGDRRGQPVRRRARDRRLRVAPGGRRDPHRLPARQPALEREQAVLHGRVVDDHLRLPDPARRLRPAARAAHDLDRDGRRDHDRLHAACC